MRRRKGPIRTLPPVIRMIQERRILLLTHILQVQKGAVATYPVLARLGFSEVDQDLSLPPSPLLPPAVGTYTTRNRSGWTVVRRDLAMETVYHEFPRTITDWHDQEHNVTITRGYKRYPRQTHPARNIKLEVSATTTEDDWLISFRCSSPVAMSDDEWEASIIFQICLFLELFQDYNVLDAETGISFHTMLKRNWEILPPGEYPFEVIEEAISKRLEERPHLVAEYDMDRLKYLCTFRPKFTAIGLHELRGYCVFGFEVGGSMLYVLENARIGNAIYAFRGDWEKLSSLSKQEMLTKREIQPKRIPHVAAWKMQVHDMLTEGLWN